MKKANFNYDSLGSYKSSNHFPYGYTLLANLDCIRWNDEDPKHPEAIEEIGPFKVVQKVHCHRPRHDWGYGSVEEADVWKIIMATEKGNHLILECFLEDPAQWRPVEVAVSA